MKILAIDTAADFCALCLHENGQMVDTVIVPTERDQAKILAPLTQTLLEKYGLKTTDIDRFAIATGPGSFTGLRVGLSFVRGLALANQKKAVGFDHFEIARHALGQTATNLPTLIIRDSKRAELFCAWLREGKLEPYFLAIAYTLSKLPEMQETIRFTGNGAAQLMEIKPELSAKFIALDETALIRSLAALAEMKENAGNVPPQPLYLRDADVSFPRASASG